ncbi:MAG: hypothetical protein IPO66_18675 [Rhodanobacteraceae bacterium]|nr:hypothetical protein [Rhodanobacteraceae bacterium]
MILRHVTMVRPAIAPVGIIGSLIGGDGGESGLVLNLFNSILSGSCALEAAAIDVNLRQHRKSRDSCDLAAANNSAQRQQRHAGTGSLADHGGRPTL